MGELKSALNAHSDMGPEIEAVLQYLSWVSAVVALSRT